MSEDFGPDCVPIGLRQRWPTGPGPIKVCQPDRPAVLWDQTVGDLHIVVDHPRAERTLPSVLSVEIRDLDRPVGTCALAPNLLLSMLTAAWEKLFTGTAETVAVLPEVTLRRVTVDVLLRTSSDSLRLDFYQAMETFDRLGNALACRMNPETLEVRHWYGRTPYRTGLEAAYDRILGPYEEDIPNDHQS
jgi:hypothetical protein